MSNIAGKAYAMNLITPIHGLRVFANKLIFWAVGTPVAKLSLRGLKTLSMIHYARWVILRSKDFPHLASNQPKEDLKYGYMLFFSNFNGSWEQYVDSFSAAIPSGLNLLWWKNIGWPNAVPEQPFHRYVESNQIWTDYYYSSYPMAASNDVKSAELVKQKLCTFIGNTTGVSPNEFSQRYNLLLKDLQCDLGLLDATPIVSLAAEEISARRRAALAKPAPAAGRAPEPATSAVISAAQPHNQNMPNGQATAAAASTATRARKASARGKD